MIQNKYFEGIENGSIIQKSTEIGFCKAYKAWQASNHANLDEIEIPEYLWKREIPDFLDGLRTAGIETFVCTNENCAVENIYYFVKNGCSIIETCLVTRYYNNLTETAYGIRLSVNGKEQ